MTRIIAISGIMRSGSTWEFNIIKGLLKSKGYTVSQASNPLIEDIFKSDSDFHIIKLADWNEELAKSAWKIFTSIRDINDVKSSYSRLCIENVPGWSVTDVEMQSLAEVWLRDYKKWSEIAHHNFEFNDMMQDKMKILSQICDVLNISLNPNMKRNILKRVDDLPVPPSGAGMDANTYLFPSHINKST